MNKNSNSSLRYIFSAKPVFYRKKPRGDRSEEIRGANAPLISTNKAADPRLGPRIRGQDVAKWPHPGGDLYGAGFDSLLSGWICCLTLI